MKMVFRILLPLAMAMGFSGCRATTSTDCVDPALEGPDCATPAAVSVPKAADGSPTVIKDMAPAAGSPISFTGLTSSEVTVNWGAATDDITKAEDLQYRVLKAANVAEIKIPSKARIARDWTKASTNLKVSNLNAGTAYYFMVLVKDAVGNTSYYEPKAATPKVVKAGAPVDDTSPTAGTISFSNVAAHGMTVSWTAGADDKTPAAKLRYQLKCIAAGADLATAVGVLAWTDNVTTTDLPGLASQTSYVCGVVVKDLAGNEALYPPASQTTGTDEDVPPPAPVTAITVTSPNGGEIKFRNGLFDVTWTTTNLDAEALVEVALSLNNGATWLVLSNTMMAGTGLMPWAPNQLSSAALVRVTLVSDQNVKDQSDATFEIRGGQFD